MRSARKLQALEEWCSAAPQLSGQDPALPCRTNPPVDLLQVPVPGAANPPPPPPPPLFISLSLSLPWQSARLQAQPRRGCLSLLPFHAGRALRIGAHREEEGYAGTRRILEKSLAISARRSKHSQTSPLKGGVHSSVGQGKNTRHCWSSVGPCRALNVCWIDARFGIARDSTLYYIRKNTDIVNEFGLGLALPIPRTYNMGNVAERPRWLEWLHKISEY